MDPTLFGAFTAALTLGGVLLGRRLRTVLPEAHLSGDSRDAIKAGVGLIATMTALVLGLVTASAKANFDSVDAGIRHTGVELLALDRLLARYGPESADVRRAVKEAVGRRIDAIWSADPFLPAGSEAVAAAPGVEGLVEAIRRLEPRDATQERLRSLAVDRAESLLESRWLIVSATAPSVPLPFLAMLGFWLAVTFASFGLLAPRNATVLAVLFVCALSVGGAVCLVLEMDSPFSGWLRVSAEPLSAAHAQLGR